MSAFSEAWSRRFARQKQLTDSRRQEAVDSLRQALPGLLDRLRRRGAREIWLFGSFADNRARPDSDVDLAVDLDFADYSEMFQLEAELEAVAGRSVHLASLSAMSTRRERQITPGGRGC